MDDLEPKTLDQLSLESKEKKFVSIEDGSKISGYTKEYLERLCRLSKIEYRTIKNNPEKFVLELESLLRETHTLLISREGILFVDKNELSPEIPRPIVVPPPEPPPPPPKVAPTPLPQTQAIEPEMAIPSFIPRLTPSPEELEQRKRIIEKSVVVETKTPPPAPPAPARVRPITIPHKPEEVVENVKEEKDVSQGTRSVEARTPPPPVPIVDEWDAQLFGGLDNVSVDEMTSPEKSPTPPAQSEPLYATPSPYRPIQTSINSEEHKDDAPLFPVIGEVQAKKNDVPIRVMSQPPRVETPTAPPVREPVIPRPEKTEGVVAREEPSATIVLNNPPVIPVQIPSVQPPPKKEVITKGNSFPVVPPPSAVVEVPRQSPLARAALHTPAVGRVILPEVQPEQHLTKQEPRALSKSIIFNTIFALTLISSSLLYFAHAFPDKVSSLLTGSPTVYVATAGLSDN